MKRPEEQARKRLVREWLHKAETDLQAAEALLTRDSPLLYPSCFFAQQAAEKYLKAFLVRNQTYFPKTHDLDEILDLVESVNSELASSLRGVIALTQYAVETRYPGDLAEPDSAEATAALDLAKKVRDAVLRAMQLT